jgi:UDP-N-acetylmuramoyl-tripeptide--D-alanyl-D-alanine ligase
MLPDLIGLRRAVGKLGGLPRSLRRSMAAPGPMRRFRPRIILARNLRRLWWRGQLVAITGTSGKTTATAIAGALLAGTVKTTVHIYHGSMGPISRSLIAFRPWRTDVLVVEAGIYSRGDMKIMAGMLRPDIAIVTVVGLEHVSDFRTREDVAAEKGELVAAVLKTGTAILNGDDPHVRSMAERCPGKVSFFGRCEDATLRLHSIQHRWPDGLSLDLSWRGDPFSVTCGLVGTHWVPSILGPLAAALTLGVDRARCVEALATFEGPFNRMSVHPTPAGRTFILDAYKGAHWQIGTTVSFLDDIDAPRKTIIFGTLSDRWGSTRARYYAAARAGLEHADRVIFVGPDAFYVRRMLDRPEGERVEMIPSIADAIGRLATDVVPGEVIYLKAAKQGKLERLMRADFVKVRCLIDKCGLHSCGNCAALSDETLSPPLKGHAFRPAAKV